MPPKETGSPLDSGNLREDKLPKAPIAHQLAAKLQERGVDPTNLPADGKGLEPFTPETPPKQEAPPRGEGGRFVSSKPEAESPGQSGAVLDDQGQGGQRVPPPPVKTDAAAGGQSGADTTPRIVNAAEPPAGQQQGQAQGQPPGQTPPPADDYEDIEVGDDLGGSFKFKAAKTDAERLKQGYMRRADYTRKTQMLAKYKPILEPLILDGRMESVAPLIQMATTNEAFANGVVELYNRVTQNRPVIFADAEPQPGGRAPQGNVDVDRAIAAIAQEDPIVGELLKQFSDAVVVPMQTQLNEARTQLGQFTTTQQQAQQKAQADQQRTRALEAVREQTYTAFKAAWPQTFGRDRDADMGYMSKVYKYAHEMGYIDSEGYIPGMMHGYSDALAQQQTVTPTPSPAVQTAESVEAAARAQQLQAAQGVAQRTTGVKSASGHQGAAPPPKPKWKDKDGRPRPIKDALRDAVAYTQQMHAQQ